MMTGELTARFQTAIIPRLEKIFAQAGQRVAIHRHQLPDDSPPPDVEQGVTVQGGAEAPAQPVAATYPCFAYRVPASDYYKLSSAGADLSVPLWDVLIHPDADLNTPGFSLTVYDGTLPEPLELIPQADADDLGTQRVCWRVICRAAGER